jgi:hypothetical protein
MEGQRSGSELHCRRKAHFWMFNMAHRNRDKFSGGSKSRAAALLRQLLRGEESAGAFTFCRLAPTWKRVTLP